MKTHVITLCAGAFAISGCSIDQRNYESEPVLVKTSKGIVTCQLYRDNRVLWDEAIDFPQDTMTLAEADQICLAEGRRTKEEGRRPTNPDGTVTFEG